MKFFEIFKNFDILKFFENFDLFYLYIVWVLLNERVTVISFIDFARECNMICYCTEIAFANQYVRKWYVTCIASGQ